MNNLKILGEAARRLAAGNYLHIEVHRISEPDFRALCKDFGVEPDPRAYGTPGKETAVAHLSGENITATVYCDLSPGVDK